MSDIGKRLITTTNIMTFSHLFRHLRFRYNLSQILFITDIGPSGTTYASQSWGRWWKPVWKLSKAIFFFPKPGKGLPRREERLPNQLWIPIFFSSCVQTFTSKEGGFRRLLHQIRKKSCLVKYRIFFFEIRFFYWAKIFPCFKFMNKIASNI